MYIGLILIFRQIIFMCRMLHRRIRLKGGKNQINFIILCIAEPEAHLQQQTFSRRQFGGSDKICVRHITFTVTLACTVGYRVSISNGRPNNNIHKIKYQILFYKIFRQKNEQKTRTKRPDEEGIVAYVRNILVHCQRKTTKTNK